MDNADSDCTFCFVLLARTNQRIASSRTSSIDLFIEAVGCPDPQWRGINSLRTGLEEIANQKPVQNLQQESRSPFPHMLATGPLQVAHSRFHIAMTEPMLHRGQITPAHCDDVANDASELAEQKALLFEVEL